MTSVVGIGNELRGEDAFGIDVVKQIKKINKFHCMEVMQLLPEHCLELKEAKKIIFVDASLGQSYNLATPLPSYESGFTHQITPFIFMELLDKLYAYKGQFFIYSMQTQNFDKIIDTNKYQTCVLKTCESILNL